MITRLQARPRFALALGLPRLTGLWREPNFRHLWTAQLVSQVGSDFSNLGIPLAAVLALNARPADMGLLQAAQYVPVLLLSLIAGVWVDRFRKRRILITADLGRAAVLLSVPVAAAFGALTLTQLYLVAFAVGCLGVFFDVAQVSYIPRIVPREQLIEANSKMEAGLAAARLTGPSLAGGVIQIVTAPMAIVLDALSFVISALLIAPIRTPDQPQPRASRPQNLRADIAEGLRLLLGNPVLRPLAIGAGLMNLFVNVNLALYALYLARDLSIEPFLIGVILAVGGGGALAGAALAGALGRRWGLGTIFLASTLVYGLSLLVVPIAGDLGSAAGPGWLPRAALIATLAAARLALVVSALLYRVNFDSLRQAMTPDGLQGRVNLSRTWDTATC